MFQDHDASERGRKNLAFRFLQPLPQRYVQRKILDWTASNHSPSHVGRIRRHILDSRLFLRKGRTAARALGTNIADKVKMIKIFRLYNLNFIIVLFLRQRSKLMFVLCRTCGENMSNECRCSTKERAITGVWTSMEFQLALRHGYKVLEIYEIWPFESADANLFREFVRLCLKRKAEASGNN